MSELIRITKRTSFPAVGDYDLFVSVTNKEKTETNVAWEITFPPYMSSSITPLKGTITLPPDTQENVFSTQLSVKPHHGQVEGEIVVECTFESDAGTYLDVSRTPLSQVPKASE